MNKSPWLRCIVSPYARTVFDDAPCPDNLFTRSLGGEIGSAVLGAMGDGAVFVGYGLLSGQGIRHSRQLRAAYRRFRLRDALAGMTPGEWQRGFVDLWPRLHTVDLPPPRMFELADWRSAILEAAVPGAPKSMLRLRERCG